jgi:catechol 2,3-dioxygenase-like lactoylglutathione lyase family enzyme
LPEIFSFSETLLQPGVTGNVRKSINVIFEYNKSFLPERSGKPAFFKKRVFRVIRKEFLAFTIEFSHRGTAMQCLMDHIVLNVEDDEKMVAFYAKVLMFPTERLDEYRSGKVPFPSVRLNEDTIIDLFPKKIWQESSRAGEGRENLNHFCIALSRESWQELLERLHANAVPIEQGPVPRWGAHGTGTSVYFRDPEGNLIEARYYEGHNSPGEGPLRS